MELVQDGQEGFTAVGDVVENQDFAGVGEIGDVEDLQGVELAAAFVVDGVEGEEAAGIHGVGQEMSHGQAAPGDGQEGIRGEVGDLPVKLFDVAQKFVVAVVVLFHVELPSER